MVNADKTGDFHDVDSVSISAISEILRKHKVTYKVLDKIPAGRNKPKVIERRFAYVLEFLMAETADHPRRATVSVPDSKGRNITLIMAMEEEGIVHKSVSLKSHSIGNMKPSTTDQLVRTICESIELIDSKICKSAVSHSKYFFDACLRKLPILNSAPVAKL
ncbi:unnamed protein product [Darwinula stevensoni]|uniref:Uncharacterized protein n=1 Tax=Darwinula stevensoni TaxID=69355 RepID=A0A7R9AAL3_9CRUS|nr:unnamed protein product [Darwinula stevensoni]CAG0898541.1 unnamed protein product [Darwinula stevensoni]